MISIEGQEGPGKDHIVVFVIGPFLEPMVVGADHAIRISLPRPTEIDDVAEVQDKVEAMVMVFLFGFHGVGHLELRARASAFGAGLPFAAIAGVAHR